MGIVVHIVDASIASDIDGFRQRSAVSSEDVVIRLGSMCNGVVTAFALAARQTAQGTIDALIIYGHGAPGLQGVTMGKDSGGLTENAALSVEALKDPAISQAIASLRSNFSAKGVIVLHGCNVAEGDQGRELMKAVSKLAGVPVKGSDWYQIVGRSDLAGNILVANPDGTVDQKGLEGLKNLGGYPAGESMLLLGVEFWDRLKKVFH